jgi:5-methylcytosine-specific restriction endonuclease McrA
MTVNSKARLPIPRSLQVFVFRRDGWLCCWCKRPVIFAPALKYLEEHLRQEGHTGRLAYHHAHWTRDGAPLLDELGAVVDHIDAFSTGGLNTEENLATACNKCNAYKSNAARVKWDERQKRNPVKGKYGDPQHWDGLSTLFVVLARRDSDRLTATEKDWLKAFAQ